jgi:hypothetical protein
MPRHPSDATHDQLQQAQEAMFRGIPTPPNTTGYDSDAFALPITDGRARWRTFRATLVRYAVIVEDEVVGSENVKFVGTTRQNGAKVLWTAPEDGNDNANEVGKPESVGLDVCRIHDLDQQEYEVAIECRAYDTLEDLGEELLDLAQENAQRALHGVSALLPYGGPASTVADAILDELFDAAGADNEIGSFAIVLNVEPRREWRRQENMTRWVGYRFITFSQRDESETDEADKQEELYLTLWRFSLSTIHEPELG